MNCSILLYIHILFLINISANNNFMQCIDNKGSSIEECVTMQSFFSNKRYILYDVNPLEGFNLRRDVYIRIATFLKLLSEKDSQYEWILVLPPWGSLYHWQSHNIGSQNQLPWGMFFDVKSLKRYIPVLEMHEFIKEYSKISNKTIIDCVYYLQNDETMFKTGIFKDKNEVTDCSKFHIPYKKVTENEFQGLFWSYSNISSYDVQCIAFHGTILNLRKNLKPNLYRSVMFDHMEIPLHYAYGSVEYWKARQSMRYNVNLYEIASDFKFRFFNLSKNNFQVDNEKEELLKKSRNTIGDPYLAVHFRRKDFILGRESSVTVIDAASQIKKKMELLNLDSVFVATDAEENEYAQLKAELKDYKIIRFVPSYSIKNQIKDGGIAIIDQIICSQSRYFIGTRDSTFTYRIQEDREILGFPVNSTFNFFCIRGQKCISENIWKIVWE